jgi:hypothetical protein
MTYNCVLRGDADESFASTDRPRGGDVNDHVPMMFAFCYAMFTLVTGLGANAAAASLSCTLPASIECALQTAGVRDPAPMTETLIHAELRTVGDVTELSVAEAAELFAELQAAAVPLGDRARLRKVAWVHSIAWDRQQGQQQSGGIGEQSAMMLQSGSVPPLHKTIGYKTPNAPHRQLQSGERVSIEVVAIAFTGLIGMVGYAVQARSAQRASTAQASLGREAAEREKTEAKAGKQLERVQLQMAEWVRPLVVNSNFLVYGWATICRECKLLGYLRLYSVEHVPQPATPYINLRDCTNRASFAAMGAAPYAQLPPEDVARLATDPALRSRYCELAATVLLPPLRRLSLLFATKSHLNESLAPARLDSVLPGIGRDWASLLGTLTNLYFQLHVYAGQFESLVGRWEQERFDLLQPDSPGLHTILMFLSLEQTKDVATKELQLLGVSSGSRSAAGSLAFMKGGVVAAGGGKEAET